MEPRLFIGWFMLITLAVVVLNYFCNKSDGMEPDEVNAHLGSQLFWVGAVAVLANYTL